MKHEERRAAMKECREHSVRLNRLARWYSDLEREMCSTDYGDDGIKVVLEIGQRIGKAIDSLPEY